MTKKVMDFPLQYLNLTRRRNKKCGTYRNVNGFADDDRQADRNGLAAPGATKTPTITFQAALFHAGIGAVLPNGYPQIFRLNAFGPLGLKDYGSTTLRYKI